MTKSAKVRLPENRPDEVSILRAGGLWRVFVRESGKFAVKPYVAEADALNYASKERERLGLPPFVKPSTP